VTATDQDPAALLEALHAALDADPSDSATRQAMADLLEDQGDRVAARGQRWQAEHGKRSAWVSTDPDPERWRWWPGPTQKDAPDDLPREVFDLLPAARPDRVGRYYPSRRAAEADLALALETLASREARVAGYDGEPCPWCGDRKQVSSGREYACDGCGRRWTA
jgi:uncharacterized protein (TIGR02996 family)